QVGEVGELGAAGGDDEEEGAGAVGGGVLFGGWGGDADEEAVGPEHLPGAGHGVLADHVDDQVDAGDLGFERGPVVDDGVGAEVADESGGGGRGGGGDVGAEVGGELDGVHAHAA